MNALFQVSRLTRPQRIRCRPRLLLAPGPLCTRYIGTTASWIAPSVDDATSIKPRYRGGSPSTRADRSVGSEMSVQQRKGDRLDWEVAVEMAEARKLKDAAEGISIPTRKRNPDLPSLAAGRRIPLSIKSATPRVNSSAQDHTQADAARAGVSGSDNVATSLSAAGPSSQPATSGQSRKGKEKAVNADQAELQPSLAPSAADMSCGTHGGPSETLPSIRRNPVGVQLLSPSLHQQLFPSSSQSAPPQALVDISRAHLAAHGLSPEGAAVLPEIAFDMPPLQGSDLREHFHNLGASTAEPYLSMAQQLAEVELPQMPDKWESGRAGWTKYNADGSMEQVRDLGGERMVSFDVETLYKLSPYPVMAVAASPTAWYSWLSPSIFQTQPVEEEEDRPVWDRTVPPHHPNQLIPLFPQPRLSFTGQTPRAASKDDQARLVIGHNVGYDRARVQDEYSLERTSTRWLDTLSLHVATHGITSVQRPAWQKYRKNKRQKLEREAEALAVMRDAAEEEGDVDMLAQLDAYALDMGFDGDTSDPTGGDGGAGSAAQAEASQKRWEDITSINSLAEVAALHCGYDVDKSVRNRFADDDVTHASQLLPELDTLISYCAKDVQITHGVYRKVFPLFQQSCPHPASLSGVLSMGNSFLPVDENWEKYLQAAESKYREMDEGVRRALRVLAEKTRKEGRKEGDVWSEQLDWSEKRARWTEEVGQRAMKELLGDEYSATTGTDGTAEIKASSSETSETVLPADPVKIGPVAEEGETVEAQTQLPRPAWQVLLDDIDTVNSPRFARTTLPLLLQLSYKTYPVVYLQEHAWCFRVPEHLIGEFISSHSDSIHPGPKDKLVSANGLEEGFAFFRFDKEAKKTKLTGPGTAKLVRDGLLASNTVKGQEVLAKLGKSSGAIDESDVEALVEGMEKDRNSVWAKQLDWTAQGALVAIDSPTPTSSTASVPSASRQSRRSSLSTSETWPKWYYDLTAPASRLAPGQLDLTTKKSVAPLLLRLQWKGFPLCYSRKHKWLFRVPAADPSVGTHGVAVILGFSSTMELSMDKFKGVDSDAIFRGDTDHLYYRLPHKDGDGHNVGNPLSKSFVKAIESGDLASAAAADGQADEVARKAAADATNMNVLCSYWISSRERIMGQMVVYDRESNRNREDEGRKLGMILPQVITMGTVTRRAVEATWLTASNAKKNRVGSELKAMVRAPPGYALVGADVDSEELWISSIMGDSQFGMHGASAVGWMTLEGTKSAGTDLHSKTANILGISRDAAKVFNYSRIYGAGQKHAVQLLLQGDPSLSKEDATTRAEELYKQTKGSKANRTRTLPSAKTPSLWHGGSESYLFNTLETIAHAERPTTPALGCGVTRALTKGYLESESSFLPSRINWVVQSSGVDYLHLLIVSMEYLIKTYGIQARYLISVHDEVRYLAKEEDRYRTALALQIANAWTRALFCYNLGMDDMPQGVAFFSAVDVDKVLRKEVFMGCETPSHPNKIPEGESLGVEDVLKITGGYLGPVIASTPPTLPVLGVDSSASGNASETAQPQIHASLYKDITSPSHRLYLQAQAAEGSALARSWLDRQAPIESQAQAMVRNVRKKVRNFGPARGAAYGRGRGAKADAVMARVKESMRVAKEGMREVRGHE